MHYDRRTVFSGLIWKFVERLSVQGVTLVVSILLARLLPPEEHGIIALVTVFIAIANIFVTSGFSTALIQKKDADTIDFSTVFTFTLIFSGAIYLFLYAAAPAISVFYELPVISPVLRVIAVTVPLCGVYSIQQAYVTRQMEFKKLFYATLISSLISAVIGITMAYTGYGVWALVAQSVVANIANVIIIQFFIDWRPTRDFSFDRLKGLFSYGWKLMLQSLLIQFYSSFRSLAIGKKFSPADLAYYSKGNMFTATICGNIDTTLSTVMFPAMSREQDSVERIKSMTRRTLRTSSYLLSPMMVGLMVVAEPLVLLLLTEPWLPAVPFMVISCAVLMIQVPQSAIIQAVKGIGRSDFVLKYELPSRVVELAVMLVSIQFGLIVFALMEIAVTLFDTIMRYLMAKRTFGYTLPELCRDLFGNSVIAFIMGAITWFAGSYIDAHVAVLLVAEVMIGAATYFILSLITKNDSFYYILNLLKTMIKKDGKECV